MAITRRMTIEEYEALEQDEPGYELVEGELKRTPPAGGQSSSMAVGIAAHLWNFVTPRQLGMVFGADGGFVLRRDPDTLLVPDVAFVRTDRLPPESEQERFWRLAPDLVVEVISPSDRVRDVVAKVQRYLDAGVRLVWVVEPRRHSVTVYPANGDSHVLLPGDVLGGGDVLPDFRLPVADVFPEPLQRRA